MRTYIQVVNKPTRDNNALDLLFTNFPELFSEVSTHTSASDHRIVRVNIFGTWNAIPLKSVTHILWHRADERQISEAADSLLHDFKSNCADRNVHQNWDSFRDGLHSLINDFVPVSRSARRGTNKPWFNDATKRSLRRSGSALRSYRRYPSPENLDHYRNARYLAKRTLKSAKFSYDRRMGDIMKK